MSIELPWAAGTWSQNTAFTSRSRHKTRKAAIKAAIRYARDQRAPTGGALTWAGGVRDPDDGVTWYDTSGRIEARWDRHGHPIPIEAP